MWKRNFRNEGNELNFWAKFLMVKNRSNPIWVMGSNPNF